MLKMIGAGAVGMLLAAYLTEAGFQVHLVTRREEQAKMLNRDGLRLIREDREIRYPVFASTELEPNTENRLTVVSVKSYDLDGVKPLLSSIDRGVPLLFIQNGLSQLSFVKHIEHANIAFGSVEHGALKIDDRTVQHTGLGVLRLAYYRGDKSKFKSFSDAGQASFPIVIEEEAEKMLLRKTILNSLINPLTAILQVRNGQLLQTDKLELMRKIYEEIIEAFPEMQESVTFDHVVGLCKTTGDNRSSMFSDRIAGRKTETEAITGELLRMAERRYSDLPTLRALHMLMKALDEGGNHDG